ncbi:MAG: YfhO family protein [Bacteroidaceae bacterium]|nr:YfhO family protein [Bacteroidaceae bacterium]
MKKENFLQKYGAYAAALVLFVAIACIYCSPALEGKVIRSGDSTSAAAAVHESTEYTRTTGDYSFWTGSMFSGMPNYQIGGGHYEANDWLKPFRKIMLKGHWSTPWVFIIFFVCFYILMRAFNINKWLSIVGALATGFSSYFFIIVQAGHNSKTSSIALISVVAAGFYLIFRKRYGWGVVLTMLFTAIGFGNHPQMSYYLFMMIGLFFFAELYIHIKEKRYKDLAIGSVLFFGSLFIGLGTGSSTIFVNQEYAEQTMRGGHSDLQKVSDAENKTKGLDLDYATQWSYGIDESLSFLIPGVMGGASTYDVGTDSELYKSLVKNGVPRNSAAQFCANVPLYWGDQPFTAGNVYMGAIVCFLFVLGLLIVKGPYKWAILAATLFSVFLAWGHNFMPLTEFFFKYFPMYNKFRAVSSILIVAEVAMPLLGFLAIKELMDGTIAREKAMKSIYIATGVTAGICLFIALFGGMVFDFKAPVDAGFASSLPDFAYQGILAEREALMKGDAWRSFLFIVLAAATLWVYAKGWLKWGYMVAILGVLVMADMWPVNKRYLNDEHFVTKRDNKAAFQMYPYEQQILQDKDPHFRVMNLTTNTFNDARTSYYLKSIGGYSAAKLRRYQDLIDQHISKMNMGVIGMLNAKYFIVPDQKGGQPAVQRNPFAMGNAWFVDTLQVVDTPNEESDALNHIDLHTTAVLDKEFAPYVSNFTPGTDSTATVRLTKYTPRYLDYEYTTDKPGTIVFSEIYYPYGWKATIDGEPADIYRVNYMLRAINVPAGKHTIHMEFAPDSAKRGDTIALICIGIMYATILFVIAFSIFRAVRKRKVQA